MKHLLLALFTINLMTQYAEAEMRYNPLNNLIYSHPETSDINQHEYRLLIAACIEIENRMEAMNGGKPQPKKDVIDQSIFFLKTVNTATALRLIADIKTNTISYANGTFMKKLFA